MLVEFTIENYRSLRDRATWSMEPEPRLSERDAEVNQANIFRAGDVDLLAVAGVYGANASGKSNVIRAIFMLRAAVLNSSKESQAGEGFPVEPFKLDPAYAQRPCALEAVGLIGARQFRYLAEFTAASVVREGLWFREAAAEEEQLAYMREGDAYTVGSAWSQDIELERRTRSDALHLSVAAQFHNAAAESVVGWFRDLRVINTLAHLNNRQTAAMLGDPVTARLVRALLQSADLGIVDVRAEQYTGDDLPDNLPAARRTALLRRPPRLVFTHRCAAGLGVEAEVRFDEDEESAGTLKLAQLAGAIVHALHRGTPLIVDEIDARLHTLLTLEIIRLFQDESTNPRRAQLLFATHDTNLITRTLLRRDQVWFTEKDRATGATALYSLAEIRQGDGKVVRNDRNYEADYLQGRYGAIPFFGDLRGTLSDLMPRDPA
jgi:predicted ATPase